MTKVKEKHRKVKLNALQPENITLVLDPQEKILAIKNFVNTGFVNIVLEKRFYMRVEKITEKLGITPDTVISIMLLLTLKKLEDVTKKN